MITQKKQERLLREVTTVARKVYGAVPIQEVWGVTQVISELGRLGIMPPRDVVHGCLAALVHCGLVLEPAKNTYIRESIRPPDETPDEEETPMANIMPPIAPLAPPTAPTPLSLSDRLGNLASDMRVQIDRQTATALALESLALDVAHLEEHGNDELTELRDMRRTLQSLLGR